MADAGETEGSGTGHFKEGCIQVSHGATLRKASSSSQRGKALHLNHGASSGPTQLRIGLFRESWCTGLRRGGDAGKQRDTKEIENSRAPEWDS